MSEQWRPVVGYEGRYDVSNHGQVKSLRRVAVNPYKMEAPRRRTIPEKILVGYVGKKGYVVVNLSGVLLKVHRLVLFAFVGPCPEGLECRHMDGDRTNNRLENLCWGTHIENCRDRDRHGTTARGERSGSAVLTEKDVRRIHSLFATGQYAASQLAAEFNVSQPTIDCVLKGKTFRHLGLPVLVGQHSRGRNPRNKGETHGNSKLTEPRVRKLRRLLAEGRLTPDKKRELSRRWDIHAANLEMAARGLSWKHVV